MGERYYSWEDVYSILECKLKKCSIPIRCCLIIHAKTGFVKNKVVDTIEFEDGKSVKRYDKVVPYSFRHMHSATRRVYANDHPDQKEKFCYPVVVVKTTKSPKNKSEFKTFKFEVFMAPKRCMNVYGSMEEWMYSNNIQPLPRDNFGLFSCRLFPIDKLKSRAHESDGIQSYMFKYAICCDPGRIAAVAKNHLKDETFKKNVDTCLGLLMWAQEQSDRIENNGWCECGYPLLFHPEKLNTDDLDPSLLEMLTLRSIDHARIDCLFFYLVCVGCFYNGRTTYPKESILDLNKAEDENWKKIGRLRCILMVYRISFLSYDSICELINRTYRVLVRKCHLDKKLCDDLKMEPILDKRSVQAGRRFRLPVCMAASCVSFCDLHNWQLISEEEFKKIPFQRHTKIMSNKELCKYKGVYKSIDFGVAIRFLVELFCKVWHIIRPLFPTIKEWNQNITSEVVFEKINITNEQLRYLYKRCRLLTISL